VTVVSDGRTLTSGTSEQTEFVTPAVVSPEGARITDAPTMTRIATMVEDRSNNTALLVRPEPPDSRADVSRRPFSAAGTYALYNASSPLEVEVAVVCAGQEQRWTFKSEGNAVSGTVNCAVEPARSNVLARLVYQNSC
jgi:hypothetical protein